ncbi:hypothetical protein F5887DRAFT_24363 [Amanita rubescens]|nr:hypothetical protein F5887DRAFT_24363 [Amanita rubescens]
MARAVKRPPSFQHFPPNRAKKLKKTWVQTAKIKSKWKAEKRKAGLLPHAQLTQAADNLSGGQEEAKESDETSSLVASSNREEQKQHEAPPPKRPVHVGDNRIAGQSARQLAKQAYSPSSLHTRKSKHGRSGRDEGRVGRKGQPDMKLRMSAILAKIKQDHI